MKKIVITGGPGSGKTVITAALAAEQPDRFVLVPEAATQIYTQLQTRWDKLDLAGRHDAQRRMYRLQLDQEARIAAAHPDKILLLDRGTVDGSAYWPEGPEAFWRDISTTHAAELARYDAVILLETCAVLGLYDGDNSNFCRFEDGAAAVRSSEALKQLWAGHPQLHFVDAYPTLDAKIAAVREILDKIKTDDDAGARLRRP
jgi:predicted ATPase